MPNLHCVDYDPLNPDHATAPAVRILDSGGGARLVAVLNADAPAIRAELDNLPTDLEDRSPGMTLVTRGAPVAHAGVGATATATDPLIRLIERAWGSALTPADVARLYGLDPAAAAREGKSLNGFIGDVLMRAAG